MRSARVIVHYRHYRHIQLAFMHITHTPCVAHRYREGKALSQAFRRINSATCHTLKPLPLLSLSLCFCRRLCCFCSFGFVRYLHLHFAFASFVIKFQVQFEFIGCCHSTFHLPVAPIHPLTAPAPPFPPCSKHSIVISPSVCVCVCVIQPIWLAQLVILSATHPFLYPVSISACKEKIVYIICLLKYLLLLFTSLFRASSSNKLQIIYKQKFIILIRVTYYYLYLQHIC